MWSGFAGKTIYLDTNIVIFAVEQGNPWSEMLRQLFNEIDSRAMRAVTSELTLAEALAKPMKLGAQDLVEKNEELLAPESPIETAAVDRIVLTEAARLRGQTGLKLMDAIHVATAQLLGCDLFLSNDESLGRRITVPKWLQLSDVVAGK
jgi:predicted nucleic acid-binding protein